MKKAIEYKGHSGTISASAKLTLDVLGRPVTIDLKMIETRDVYGNPLLSLDFAHVDRALAKALNQ